MSPIDAVDRQRVTRILWPFVAWIDRAGSVTEAELTARIDEVLRGPKQIHRVVSLNIITRREGANLLAAHVESWVMERSGSWLSQTAYPADAELSAALESALFDPLVPPPSAG